MQKTVLVFDSGVGGLSIYQELKKLLSDLNYIYLFDNKAYPYGELEDSILIERVNKLVSNMLLKHKIDIVVIACNTASTIVLPSLRQRLTIPVVGVIPAIKPAALLSKKAIGIIATPATIKRKYIQDLIAQYSNDIDVKLLGSTKLVDIAEEKMRGNAIDIAMLQEILFPLKEEIDVAVLGCTHFPLLSKEIKLAFDDRVILIDSGIAIAKRVQHLLGITHLNTQVAAIGNHQLDDRVGIKEYKTKIYASTQPWGLAQLNMTLSSMNFSPIKLFHLDE